MISKDDARRLMGLTVRIQRREATEEELRSFAGLLEASGLVARGEVEGWVREQGFASLQDFARHIREPDAKWAARSLVGSGIGFLMAYAVAEALAAS